MDARIERQRGNFDLEPSKSADSAHEDSSRAESVAARSDLDRIGLVDL